MAIQIIQHTGRPILHGLLAGGLGGLVGGYLNVIAINFYILSRNWLNSPFDPPAELSVLYLGQLSIGLLFHLLIPFAPFGCIIGFLAGSLLGGIISLTPLTSNHHLLRFTQLFGSILVAIPTTRFLEVNTPTWLTALTMLLSLTAGFIGGTVAYRCYQRLSP